MSRNDVEQAERYERRRAALLPALAILLVAQQGAFMLGGAEDGRQALLSGVVWMAMASVLILLTAGRLLFVRKPVRDLMNDEASLAARRKSNALGFLNAMITAVLLYGLTFVRTFTVREAMVVIFAVGMGSALLSLGVSERQALGDK